MENTKDKTSNKTSIKYYKQKQVIFQLKSFKEW